MTVSVIIPTLDRAEALGRTLQSVTLIERIASFEIVVVDNGSVDSTEAAFDQARAAAPDLNWKYVREAMPGLLSARHRGAIEAQGDICAFLDDDVRVGREWMVSLEEAFRDSSVVLAGGPSTPLFESNPPDWLSMFYNESQQGRSCGWLSLFDGGDKVKEIDPRLVFGLNFSIRKDVLLELGGFHPDCISKPLQRFQGDGETGLSLKIAQAGLKALYHPQISVHHEIASSRLTWEYFEQRAFYQGVCDSYTRIRAEGGVAKIASRWRSSVRRIKSVLRDAISSDSNKNEILNRTSLAHRTGCAFHQNEVRNDAKLLDWVLRKDYWDYRLPAGWEMRWRSKPERAQAGLAQNAKLKLS